MTLLGRGSLCINSGGENIYPDEVESALKSHPAVFDAVVVGVPDDRWGERVAAVVQPRPGPHTDHSQTIDGPLPDQSSAATKSPASSTSSPKCQRSPSRQSRLQMGEAVALDKDAASRRTTAMTEPALLIDPRQAHIVTLKPWQPPRSEERHQYGDALPPRRRMGR